MKLIFMISVFILSLHSASFNCKKANTFIEHTICNDAELSKLDDILATTYKETMSRVSNKENLKNLQFTWLKNDREACKNMQCLKEQYSKRIEFLNSYYDKQTFNNPFAGNYSKNDSTIRINNNNYFEIVSINSINGNSCYIDGIFLLKNNMLFWKDKENDCSINIIKVNNNTIFLEIDSECSSYYCGVRAGFDRGEFKRR